MDVRGKLVELIGDCKYWGSCEEMADYLIANGVAVQEWFSVKDRLPEESGLYITFGCTAAPVRWLHNFDKDVAKFGTWWNYEPDGKEHPRYRFIEAGNITHWMPLPQPPVDMSRMFENVSADDLRAYREKTQPPKGE